MAPARRPTNLEVDTSGTATEEPRRSARLATPRSARASEAPVSPAASRKRTRIAENTGDDDEAMMDGVPEVEENNGGGKAQKAKEKAKAKAKAQEAEESNSDLESESDDDGAAPQDTKKAATKPVKPLPKATARQSSRSTGTTTNKGKAEESPWWEEIPPSPDPDEDSDDGEDAFAGTPMKRFTTSSGPGGVLKSVIYVVDENSKPQCRLRSQSDLPTHVAENWDGLNLGSLEAEIKRFDGLINKKVKGSHRSFQLVYFATYPNHPQGKAMICGQTTVGDQKLILTGWKKHWCALYGRTNAQNAINRECRKKEVTLPFKVSSVAKGHSAESSRASSSLPPDLEERLEQIERGIKEMTAQISERSASPESPTPERTVHKPDKSTGTKGVKEAVDNNAAERKRLLAKLAELDEPGGSKSIPRIVVS